MTLHSTQFIARHATHLQVETDKLACAAQDLITVLKEVRGIRTCDPTPAGIERFNAQQAEVAGLMQAYIDAVFQQVSDHNLEEDGDGKILQCDGFDCRVWRLPEGRS